MEGEGMVAVVRGLKDAGLAVTLLESGRQYTLLPDAVPVPHPVVTQVNYNNPEAYQYAGHQATPQYQSGAQYGAQQGASQYANHQSTCQYAGHQSGAQYAGNQAAYQYATNSDVSTRRESGVQATDGRYASTYRMMHCHMTPTSPPDLVTEFPPQKAELCPGRENFQIGGYGSGETYSQASRCNSYRGGMNWPDRGSVCSPKPSVQPDSFTNSLRKYPNLSQDRSSEIVERLISFTQAKHYIQIDFCYLHPELRFLAETVMQTCPVCRSVISFDVQTLEQAPPPVDSVNAPPFRLTEDLKALQARMAAQLARQVARGGVVGSGDDGPPLLTISTAADKEEAKGSSSGAQAAKVEARPSTSADATAEIEKQQYRGPYRGFNRRGKPGRRGRGGAR